MSTADIAEAVRIAISGDHTQRLAKLNLPERQVPIRLGFAVDALSDPALVGQLRVPGTHGAVPLAAVADTNAAAARPDPRYERQRNITSTAELNGRPLGEVMVEVPRLPTTRDPPPGVVFLNTGDAEIFVDCSQASCLRWPPASSAPIQCGCSGSTILCSR